MNQNFITLTEIIKSRRSTFPPAYKPGKISTDIITSLLDLPRWAPNHKKTEPWRFVVIQDDKLLALGEQLQMFYKTNTPTEKYDEVKYKKAGENPQKSACVIAICVHRSPASVIPAWEETAAVACSVQNLWLGCAALGIGSYWSTPGAIKGLADFLQLESQQECIGLFYMGWTDQVHPTPQRKEIDQIVRFL